MFHNWSLLLGIAKKHLLSRLKQSSIAALGVTFGIATYVILMSFMTGLNGLLDGLILNRTPHIHLYNDVKPTEDQPVDLVDEFRNSFNVVSSVKPKQTQLRIHNALAIQNTLSKDKRVKGVTPQVAAQVFYIGGSTQLNGRLNGLNVLDEVKYFNFGDYVVKGSPNALARNEDGILLGAGIAKKLSLDVGDRIQVSTASGGMHQLKIVGIYQSGMADFDNVQSFANLKTVQRILGEGANYISDLNVKLHDMAKAPDMANELQHRFNATAMDIQRANAQFETGTKIRNLISYAVSITLLLVAGFGIYNILNMMIYEKMNDIAILKATGFSGGDVMRIFIYQAMLIGLVGGLIGLTFGYFISVAISHTPFETEALPTIKTYPVNFNPMFYIIGVIFALGATFLAGYLPARKAKKIDPVIILRGQ